MKLFRKAISLCVFFIAFSLIGCNSASINNQLPVSKPKDFNFVFNFGVNAKNQLDSTKGQFTKDMVTEPSITTNLKLSDEEINTIYSEMRKINILNYPEYFKPKSNTIQIPFNTYSLKLIVDSNEKNISWKDDNVSKTKEAVQLRELFQKIQDMINNKEEFRKLPTPKSAYQ